MEMQSPDTSVAKRLHRVAFTVAACTTVPENVLRTNLAARRFARCLRRGKCRNRRPAISGWSSVTDPRVYVGRRAMKRALAEGQVV